MIFGIGLCILLLSLMLVLVAGAVLSTDACKGLKRDGSRCRKPTVIAFAWCEIADHQPGWLRRMSPRLRRMLFRNSVIVALCSFVVGAVPLVFNIPDMLTDKTRPLLAKLSLAVTQGIDESAKQELSAVLADVDNDNVARSYPQYLAVVAKAYAMKGDMATAMALSKKSTELLPESVNAHTSAAALHYEFRQDYDAAIEWCDRALKIDPHDYHAQVIKGLSMVLRSGTATQDTADRSEDLERAVSLLRSCIADTRSHVMEPQYAPAALGYYLIVALVGLARVEEARLELTAVAASGGRSIITDCEWSLLNVQIARAESAGRSDGKVFRAVRDTIRAHRKMCGADDAMDQDYVEALRAVGDDDPMKELLHQELLGVLCARLLSNNADQCDAWVRTLLALIDLGEEQKAVELLAVGEREEVCSNSLCLSGPVFAQVDFNAGRTVQAFAHWKEVFDSNSCRLYRYAEVYVAALLEACGRAGRTEKFGAEHRAIGQQLIRVCERMLAEIKTQIAPAGIGAHSYHYALALGWWSQEDYEKAARHARLAETEAPGLKKYSDFRKAMEHAIEMSKTGGK